MGRNDTRRILEGATTGEIRDLLRKVEETKEELREALLEASKDPKLELSSSEVGSSKDSFVQKVAADYLKKLRKQNFSLEAIGDMYGVSRERVRQVYEKLCPFEYEKEKEERAG